jgi:signal peptidase I
MGQRQLRCSEPSMRLLLFGCMTLNVVLLVVVPVSHALGLSTVSVFVLQSNSMFPTLRKDDMVVMDSNVSFDSLKVGDIIAFNTYGTNDSGQHETILSRVQEITTNPSNERVIRTKGDANPLTYEIRFKINCM